MIKSRLSKIEELYSKNIDNYGITSKSVGWPDINDHFLRFDKLLSVIERMDEEISINDLGCGYGELFKHMLEKSFKISTFHGYDISQKMIDAAETYIKNKNVVFHLNSRITFNCDYSFASGIFNVKFEEKDSDWQEYIEETLFNLNEYSEKGFAFNLLTKYVDYKQPHLFYGDPVYFFDFCKRNFSKFVSVFHDYPLYEWTIIVKKNKYGLEKIGSDLYTK